MRGLSWLVGAGALIGAGGWLMTQGDGGAAVHKQRDALAFPTYQRPAEASRETVRRTLSPEPVTQEPAKRPHDPLLVALGSATDVTTALVFEAGTTLRAPVGQAMLACMSADERAHMNNALGAEGKTWLDLADRVGFSKSAAGGELFVVQGNLAGIDLTKVVPTATPRAYGAATTIYDQPEEAGRPKSFHGAIWHDGLLLAAGAAGAVERAIDRLDAGGAGTTLAFDESEAYGEVYGVVGPDDLAKLVPEDLRDRVRDVATRADVHVDATDQVFLVVDLQGRDAAAVTDLGKSLGAAMAVGRLEASREGNDDMVRLMDLSRVRPFGDGRLRAEVAIPTELMTKHMRGCKP